MTVSIVNRIRLTLPQPLTWPVLVAGVVAVLATYWDEAWHTDVGRDTTWSAPHLLLYGSIAVVGLSVAGWGMAQLLTSRSLWTSLHNRPLLAAGTGALGTLVAAPTDAFWHEAYGRDAVVWSQPHLLALLGAVGLVLGVAAGLPERATAARIAAGVLLLGNAAAVLFEYEADVPQFSEVLYVPLLVLVAVGVALVVERLVPGRGAVTAVVLGYVAVRLLVTAGLASVGRSSPDLPMAILGLALWDLPWRSRMRHVAAAVAGVSSLALAASWTGLASQPVAAVALTAAPLLGVALAVLVTGSMRTAALGAAALAAVGLSVAPQDPAEAHDPGQGRPVVGITLAMSVADDEIAVAAAPSGHCDDLVPVRVVARRAGETRTGPLRDTGSCRSVGAVAVTAGGRWFTYVEFEHEHRTLEAWLPVDTDSPGTRTERRDLYLPAGGGQDGTPAQLWIGALLYLLGLVIVGLGWTAVRGARVAASSRTA